MSDASKPEDIEAVSKALRQVLMVTPQLLFDASKKLGSTMMVESMTNEIKGAGEEKRMRDHVRQLILTSICRNLLQSGLAELTEDDYASMAAAMHLMSRVQP